MILKDRTDVEVVRRLRSRSAGSQAFPGKAGDDLANMRAGNPMLLAATDPDWLVRIDQRYLKGSPNRAKSTWLDAELDSREG